MAHHIQRADGSVRVVHGYKHKPALGAAKFSPGKYASDELPSSVDLRPKLSAIEDQGDTNSCVANAVAGAYEYLAQRHLGEAYDVSRMFVYYNARSLEGDDIEDEGTSISDAIASLKKFGACAEPVWPFQKSHVNTKPKSSAYQEASKFKVEHTEQVETDLDAWRHALAEGRPIIFGLTLFDSFDKARKGKVPRPTDQEQRRGKHGKHAMLAVGYSDTDELFIVRNSWGTDWGDDGYCYIPYDYVMNEKYNSGDSWIIRQLDDAAEDDQSHWGDDTSILPTIEHELGNLDDDEYQVMLEALGDVPLESRIALLYLAAAGADGDISEQEVEALSAHVQEMLAKIGSQLSAKKVLQFALKHLDDEKLLEDSITLLGAHLSSGMLASIVNSMKEIAGADELDQGEQDFIDLLVEAWEVGAASTGDDDEDDTDDSDEKGSEEDDTDDDSDDDDSDDDEDSDDDDDSDEEDSDDDDKDDDSDDDDDEDDDDDDDDDDEDDSDEEDES
jgi:uncharacterized tellurite resistance protein B-like protein